MIKLRKGLDFWRLCQPRFCNETPNSEYFVIAGRFADIAPFGSRCEHCRLSEQGKVTISATESERGASDMTAAIFIEGERLRKEGKYAEAVVKYREVLAADESHVLSHLALAVVHGLLGEHDEAVASGRRACELEPDDTFNFTALSVTYKRAFDATQDSKYIQLAEDALGRGGGE
jgi:tetratricopeptide (TPR) repeat protein